MQWRARGYLGHQVVLLAYSEQGCALMGLCLTCVKWECVPAVRESEKHVCTRPESRGMSQSELHDPR